MNNKEPFITIQSGISGHFAVMFWYNPKGFWEPLHTGIGRYKLKEDAMLEAEHWANSEGIEFKP